MKIHISELASAKLKLILLQESNEETLAFRIVPLTSGCQTPAFALELTEVTKDEPLKFYHGIPFLDQSEHTWLDGLRIDLNRINGKLAIYHPNPSFLMDCQITSPKKGKPSENNI